MKRLGILVMVVAFAATGCTTRKGAGIGLIVGAGMVVGGGIVAVRAGDDGGGGFAKPGQVAAISLALPGLIVLVLSAVGVVVLPADKPTPSTLAPTASVLSEGQCVNLYVPSRGAASQCMPVSR